MDRYKIKRGSDGSITFSGIDMGGVGTVIEETKEHIAIKFPSGSHFAGIGCRAYHSPSIYVLRKDKDGWAYKLINWHVTKTCKKPV